MNARPTAEQIDHRVLDATAALIARHGLQVTSTQQVADAVGYSKASIFNRYGSKEQLLERALQRCVDLGVEVLARVEHLPGGAARDRSALAALLELGLRWPGFLALALASVTVRERGELGEGIGALGDALLAAFALASPAESNDPDRLLRALGSVAVVAVLGLNADRYGDEATTREVILDAAVGALG